MSYHLITCGAAAVPDELQAGLQAALQEQEARRDAIARNQAMQATHRQQKKQLQVRFLW